MAQYNIILLDDDDNGLILMIMKIFTLDLLGLSYYDGHRYFLVLGWAR